MGDEIETTRSASLMSFGSRTKTRTTSSMSFGLRTRSVLGGSVLGGDDLDGGVGVGVRSRWWCDLSGTISTVQTRRHNLVGVSGVGA